MINTVIFDLDGTLLNTLNDIHISFNYALKMKGYKTFNAEEVKSFVGSGIDKAFERAVGEAANESEIKKLSELFKQHYIKHGSEHTKPYDGIIDMLINLKEKGYKIGVVSNKYDEAVRRLCREFFLEYVDAAVGESEKIKKKPDIDGVIEVCNRLGRNLPEVVYVGDSEVDIETAKNAKIPCISVLWGFKKRDFLENAGARVFISAPVEIEAAIQECSKK